MFILLYFFVFWLICLGLVLLFCSSDQLVVFFNMWGFSDTLPKVVRSYESYKLNKIAFIMVSNKLNKVRNKSTLLPKHMTFFKTNRSGTDLEAENI